MPPQDPLLLLLLTMLQVLQHLPFSSSSSSSMKVVVLLGRCQDQCRQALCLCCCLHLIPPPNSINSRTRCIKCGSQRHHLNISC